MNTSRRFKFYMTIIQYLFKKTCQFIHKILYIIMRQVFLNRSPFQFSQRNISIKKYFLIAPTEISSKINSNSKLFVGEIHGKLFTFLTLKKPLSKLPLFPRFEELKIIDNWLKPMFTMDFTTFFHLPIAGEQTYCRNDLLDKVSKTVLGHNVENFFPNWHFGSKCRILLNSINRS